MDWSKLILLSVCLSTFLMGQNAKLYWGGNSATAPNHNATASTRATPDNEQQGKTQNNSQTDYKNLADGTNDKLTPQSNGINEQQVSQDHFEQFAMNNARATYKVDSNMASLLGKLHIGNGQCLFQFDLRKAPQNKGWRLLVKILSDNRVVLTDMVYMDDLGCVYKEHMMMMDGDDEQQQRDDYLEVKENDDILLGKNKILKIRKTVGMDVVENEPIVSLDEKITGFLQIIQWIGTLKQLPKDGLTVRWVAASKPLLVKVTDESTSNNRIFAINKVDYTQQNDVKQVSIKFVFPLKHNTFSYPDRIIISMGGKELSLVRDK